MGRTIKFLCGSLLAMAFLFVLGGTNTYAATGKYQFSGINNRIEYSYDDDTLTVSIVSGEHIASAVPSDLSWHNNNKNDVKKIIISEEIDTINPNTFRDYPNLEEVVFPKTMGGQIGNYAFYNCPKLKNITIPDGISRIGEYAFYNTGITKVEAPIFLDWIEEHAFNDGTEIIMLKEQEGIIAAGTAGPMSYLGDSFNEGRPQNNNCYNKYYYSYYYDDTAFWRLYEDGTMVVWGTDLSAGYTSSRVPWGCYKSQIKRIIFNDDKTGKLTKRNKLNSSELLPNAKYTIYATKPVEEIMNNRIKVINGPQLWDCRSDCIDGFRNLETITINRGTEIITDSALNSMQSNSIKDIYISKYVKTVGVEPSHLTTPSQKQFFLNSYTDEIEQKVHVNVSYEDYLNNNYLYTGFTNETGYNDIVDIYAGQETTAACGIYGVECAPIVNDVDDYYVSVNDTSAPDTITHEGKTLYKYETYITKENGSVDVSLPNIEGVEYYVKETGAPEGFQVDPATYKVDTSGKTIDIQVADYPIKQQESDPGETDPANNPNTATSTPAFYFMLFGALASVIGLLAYKKVK